MIVATSLQVTDRHPTVGDLGLGQQQQQCSGEGLKNGLLSMVGRAYSTIAASGAAWHGMKHLEWWCPLPPKYSSAVNSRLGAQQ